MSHLASNEGMRISYASVTTIRNANAYYSSTKFRRRTGNWGDCAFADAESFAPASRGDYADSAIASEKTVVQALVVVGV